MLTIGLYRCSLDGVAIMLLTRNTIRGCALLESWYACVVVS